MSRRNAVGPGWGKDRGLPTAAPPPSGPNSLNVALYPWVPEPSWYTNAVQTAWASLRPDVTINWVDYDCYHDDPPATLDVFAFDAILASYFVAKGYLQAFPVMDLEDFFRWALQGLTVNSEWLWAVPYLGCMNILIYRAGDPQLAAPDLTVETLESILGDSPDTSPFPAPGQGLLVDLTGGTTDACLYLQTVMENSHNYPLDPSLPPCPAGLDTTAIADLRTVVRIAGYLQASYVDSSGFDRLKAFLSGRGRAFVGLTENLHFFPPQEPTGYAFRPLPVASQPVSAIPLFVDAVGVNRQVDPDKMGIAIELATLIARADVATAAAVGPSPTTSPQYLTPVRVSVLSKLAQSWPIYEAIQSTLGCYQTTAFRIGDQSRAWLTANKACLVSQILGQPLEVDESVFATPGYRSTPGGLWRKT